jgi:hypothetical protein
VKELGIYEHIRVNKFVYDHIIISKIRCLDEYNVEIRKGWMEYPFIFEREWQLVNLERVKIFQEKE